MSVLSLQNVSVNVQNVALLQSASLALTVGEVVAIVGPNGAGKSTLLKTISGDIQPSSGHIKFNGKPINALTSNARAQHIATLPQHSLLSFPFSVAEVIALGRIPHATGIAADNDIINKAMAALDIQHLSHRLYPQLSGGEKQRVQLARVLVQIWNNTPATHNQRSRLLLLDEPTAHLDLGHQRQLMVEIKHFANQGCSVLMVLHDINLAIQYADRLVALNNSEIIASGTPQDVIQPALIAQLFGSHVKVLQHPETQLPLVY